MMFKRVILAISGGVDSAVAGLLLKRKGYDVVGVFMRNWDELDESGKCLADTEAEDAEWVCQKLDIPFRQVNFVKEYWTEVFSYLLDEYQNGFTPNPDIYCNKQIKFEKFFDYAFNKQGADAIATGHYARTSFGDFLEEFDQSRGVRLLRALDCSKDQTFFLSQVPQTALQHTMFPLGNMKKTVVRKVASEASLHRVAQKPDSKGICFIGKRKFASFISEYVADNPGPFIDIETNKKIGEHRGLHHWTLGQRSNLQGCVSKYYICDKDIGENAIYLTKGTNHPALFTNTLDVGPFYWIHSTPQELQTSQRHLKPLIGCIIKPFIQCGSSITKYSIHLTTPQRAISPGQVRLRNY